MASRSTESLEETSRAQLNFATQPLSKFTYCTGGFKDTEALKFRKLIDKNGAFLDPLRASVDLSSYLEHYLASVAEGDDYALASLLNILSDTIRALNLTLRHLDNPECSAILKSRFQIPVLLGRNTGSSAAARDLLKELKVGDALPSNITYDKGKGLDVRTPVNDLVAQLLSYTMLLRSDMDRRVNYVETVKKVSPRYCRKALKNWEAKLPEHYWMAHQLPPFSRVSISQWADVGLAIITHTYGDNLAAHADLAKLGESARHKYEYSKRGRSALKKRQIAMSDMLFPETVKTLRDLKNTELSSINDRIRQRIKQAYAARGEKLFR